MSKNNKKGVLLKRTAEARREALSRADIYLYEGNACLESADRMSRYAKDSESKGEKSKYLRRAKNYHEKANRYLNLARKYEGIGSGQKRFRIKGLEKAASALIAIVGIFGGFLLLSPQISGAVVGVVDSSQNMFGVIAIFVGVVGTYLFLRKR